jgi:uncharacterized protein (UPF0332 family)
MRESCCPETETETDAGVVNRLHYATFHAAQAVLYGDGENPSSHGDVRRLFGQRVVLEGGRPARRASFWEPFMTTDGRLTTVAVVPTPT